MTAGRHNLLNGHRGEDGAAAVPVLEPFTIPPSLRGPASPWPAQPAAPARARAGADTVIRYLTFIVVLAVAAFAAVVSYSHIYDLGLRHGQDGTAARLLPLSVDGLIAAASLVMLHAARNRLRVPLLSRVALVLGVGATVAANVGYGLPYGWLSAVVSAWPAVAFIVSVELAVRFVDDARRVTDADSDREDDKSSDKKPPDVHGDSGKTPIPKPPRPARKPPSAHDRVRRVITQDPGLGKKELAARARVSVRTVERVLAAGADA